MMIKTGLPLLESSLKEWLVVLIFLFRRQHVIVVKVFFLCTPTHMWYIRFFRTRNENGWRSVLRIVGNCFPTAHNSSSAQLLEQREENISKISDTDRERRNTCVSKRSRIEALLKSRSRGRASSIWTINIRSSAKAERYWQALIEH